MILVIQPQQITLTAIICGLEEDIPFCVSKMKTSNSQSVTYTRNFRLSIFLQNYWDMVRQKDKYV